MTMTSDAKRQLSTTIRGLRERLLEDLHAATETEYRLGVRARDAGLDESARTRRARLEAWMAEQVRAQAGTKGKKKRSADDFRRDAEKQAAYTLLNRLVLLRIMEATGLRKPAVVTGGWESRAYKDFRQLAPALVRGDATEGYAFLLRLVFEDLATELPGLFGPAGAADLVPIPAATLRHVVEALDAPELESCWTDDMTLGWVYQYWNDPEREALDAKLHSGGKVEPHEIASKTQMFTERYMVDWLLQNSLGPMWLAMCRKHGWTPEVEADGTLARLEERRVDWRGKREAGEVALTDLMPLHTDAERRWAYYVPQPIPDDAVEHAPETVRELKILDPAVGSGHFLVVAFDLLFALYREEARHRGEEGDERWSDRAIVERILEHNLHGIDLDPRAVQIAAAALWLKAQQTCLDAQPKRLNLVASQLRLASLPDDDPALVELRREVERDTGIPAALTDTLVDALQGADHLGSLLRVDEAVEDALRQHEAALGAAAPDQGDLFGGFGERKRAPIARDAAKAGLVDRLERFLAKHGAQDDLGLRLRGEQLANGIRFVRMVQDGTYDLVVGNPPYQGTSKLAAPGYVKKHYPRGKADLYAAFLERGLSLVRDGGVSALLTMRGWMFIKQYSELRQWLLETFDLRALHDLSSGAFEEISPAQVVVTVVTSIFAREKPTNAAIALKVFDDETLTQIGETERKRAATRCQVGRHEFDPQALNVVRDWPLVYWWTKKYLSSYSEHEKIGTALTIRQGLGTRDNVRFVRKAWEADRATIWLSKEVGSSVDHWATWIPFIMGGENRAWIEPAIDIVRYNHCGMEVANFSRSRFGRGADFYFIKGIAFAPIGHQFVARAHRFRSIISDTGASIFGGPLSLVLCCMNRTESRRVLESLNPSIHFKIADVARLPLTSVSKHEAVFERVSKSFEVHERHREGSLEFQVPGPSPWRYAQDWAQLAVDRTDGAPLPEYAEELDVEPPTDHLSFALGVALGRFGPNGEGILDPASDDLSHALPAGILFLDGTLDPNDRRDGLGHPAAQILHNKWKDYGPDIDDKRDLRTWLRTRFFRDVHKGMYENRPIHWPLSSEGKTFVAWINIHRWDAQTLLVLLAEHLHPTLARIEGELNDLRAARDGGDAKAAKTAEKRYDAVLAQRDELRDFVERVTECAEHGPPPTHPDPKKCAPREADARYAPDLDDGVMINSAALWPLLTPQWKDPKKWWKELANAKGRKDYDWSHLAMRYWPTRVDDKCRKDPSLGVAHGCFWKYHPARAWAWELRLQEEIGPDFRIEEAPYRGDGGDAAHRAAYLREHPEEALAAVEKEALRRHGRGKDKKPVPEMRLLEPGLWSALPEQCWELELRLSEKQGIELRLLAPDEPEARAAFEKAHPERVEARAELLRTLEPVPGLFDAVSDDAGADVGSEADSDENRQPEISA
jgi:hypothetical protein